MKCQCRLCTHPEIPACPRCGDETTENLLVVFYEDLEDHFGIYLCKACTEHMEWSFDKTVPLSSVKGYTYDPEHYLTWQVTPEEGQRQRDLRAMLSVVTEAGKALGLDVTLVLP